MKLKFCCIEISIGFLFADGIKKRETLYINAAQFLPMVTGWNYPIKTISTDNVLKWWKREKTGCNFFQKTILLKIKYLSVLFTYYKSEYFCLFCKWLIFNAVCIFFWKMEGRVCLRLRIPYALSTLKNGNRFSCGLFWACWRLFEAKDDTIIVFGWKIAVWACFVLRWAVFHKEWIRKNRKRTWLMKKVLLLRCPPRGKGFRGAAGLDSGRRPAFFLFLGV